VGLIRPAQAGPDPFQEKPAGEPILIGEYGSLTGPEATFGQSTHNGILLAVEQFNAAGGLNGRKVEVRVYDNRCNIQEVGTVVQRLINQDKVVAVLGEVASSRSIAGGRICQKAGVPMITPSSTNPQVTQIGDMIFRVCFIDSFQGYAAAKFARDNLKMSRVAILYDQAQAYSKGLRDDFKRAFTQMGGAITTEQAYTGGDPDYSAQLNNIRASNPEAVFIPGYYTDAGNIALQARKLGLTIPLIGGDGWDSPELANIAGPAIEGAYYANHYAPDQPTPEVREFVRAYRERFNAVADGMAATGYDAANVLFDAMKRAKSLSGKDLAQAIAETKNFRAVTGTITIDANRNARKPAVIVQMRGGEPRYVATIEPPEQ